MLHRQTWDWYFVVPVIILMSIIFHFTVYNAHTHEQGYAEQPPPVQQQVPYTVTQNNVYVRTFTIRSYTVAYAYS